jgi:hypothetical protein
MNKSIPQNVKPLLWDIDLEDLSFDKHYKFIIERILEYGDFDELRWMENQFSQEEIIETLKESTRLSAKTANYFSIVYKIPPNQIKCLKKPFTQKQNRFSN